MAGYGGSRAEGEDYNYAIHNDLMPKIAAQLGLDVLPMSDPNFNFFNAAVAFFVKKNVKGADLYNGARDIMRMMLSPTSRGPAPIYAYIPRYQEQTSKGNVPQKFDAFWQMGVYQKGDTVLKRLGGGKRQRGLSIDYGMGEDEGSIGEGLLEDTGATSAEEAYEAEEARARRDEVFAEVPDHLLTDERHGHRYVAMWDLLRENYKTPIWKLADELNKSGVTSPSGGQWGIGSTHKVRNRVLGIVKNFLIRRGVDWDSISASRKGFRFGPVLEG